MTNETDVEEPCPQEQSTRNHETTHPNRFSVLDLLVHQTEEQTNINEAIIEELAENDHELLPSITGKVPLFRHMAARAPRFYYCVTQILIPLLILLIMTIVFGWLFTLIEGPREIQDNDATLRAFYFDHLKLLFNKTDVRVAIEDASVSCFAETFNNETVAGLISTPDQQNLLQNVKVCAQNYSRTFHPVLPLDDIFPSEPQVKLHFHWITCDRSKQTNTWDDKDSQQQQYSTYFKIDFLRIYNKEQDHFLKEDDEEVNAAIYGATGSHGCKPHIGGGAWFWFTIMTTIG